jgi:hypothetical protein
MQYKTPKLIATTIILAIMAVVLSQSALADQKRIHKGSTEGPAAVLPVDQVTIEKKTLGEVITNIGREYRLSDETIIVGMNEKQVDIRDMLVPCEAEITFRYRGNIRHAERIRIKQIYPNARWQWFSKNPE